ncbi:prepilin-type N-terminal cleavage/methylation domain-containing protein, partial [Mycobacterium tuberculosis]
MNCRAIAPGPWQGGFTLVEFLVALIISM